MNTPVLVHFQYHRETKVETDASDGVVAGALTQKTDNGGWKPVAFFETMHDAELRYPIHDKELLAVVRTLQCWRPELIGLQRPELFLVITDHKALEYFGTKRTLNFKQAG